MNGNTLRIWAVIGRRSLAGFIKGPREISTTPTAHGWGFLVALAAMLYGAVNYANNLAFIMTFLLFSLTVVSLFHTRRNLRGVDVRFVGARPVFAGDDALFGLLLSARPPYRASLNISFPQGATEVSDLAPGSPSRIELIVPAFRRGWLEPGPVHLTSTYPLGLFRSRMRKLLPIRCLVYPQPLNADMPLLSAPSDRGEGTAPCPGIDDFMGLRSYQPGDPLQRIAWKASARGTGLKTKEFEGQTGEVIVLDYDLMGSRDKEWRLSALTGMVLQAHAQCLEYGLRLPGLTLPVGRGEKHKRRCLEALALHLP